jgi:hypothetical protein
MILIGLSGKIGVGKTALARELCSRMENGVRLSFGAALKREASERYGYDPQLNDSADGKNTTVHHPDLPEGCSTVREILIGMGHSRRAGDPEYWCKRLSAALDVLDTAGINMVVVDDVRFPNEVATLRLRNAFLVRVEPYDGWKPGKHAQNQSETALDTCVGWDATVRPAYGPDEIRYAANEILLRMFTDDEAVQAG